MKRRDFIKLLGTASGATIVSSCGLKDKTDKLIPYLVPPEDGIIPGQAIYHNSTCTECPAHCGLSVKVIEKLYKNEYRRYPIKLEGIPAHPINNGALCIRGQSSITRLYHPDRAKEPLIRDSKGNLKSASWEEAFKIIFDVFRNSNDKRLVNYYLSSRVTGFLSDLINSFCEEFNIVRLPEYELFSHSTLKEANRILFDKNCIPQYRIDEADLLLTIGADILETHISPVSNSILFSSAAKKDNFEWFHVEPHISLTGMNANSRLTINPGTEAFLLIHILSVIVKAKSVKNQVPEELLELIPKYSQEEVARITGVQANQLTRLSESISKASRPLVITGGVSTNHDLGIVTAILAGLIQWVTGATESSIDFSKRENYDNVGSFKDLDLLAKSLGDQRTGVLFLSKIRQLPNYLSLTKNLSKAKFIIGMTDLYEGSMKECDIIIPLSHSLEYWGDTEPRVGLRTLIQPVLQPLHNSLSEGDILINLLKKSKNPIKQSNYQEYLFSKLNDKLNEEEIKDFLSQGYHEERVLHETVFLNKNSVITFFQNLNLDSKIKKPTLILTPSIRTYDGRSNDLPLLSEIPDPITTISYGKWVAVSEDTSKRKQLRNGDEIEITTSSWRIKLPVKIVENLPEGVLTIQHDMVGHIPYQIDQQTGETIAYFSDIKISKTNNRLAIPILSGPISESDREIFSLSNHRRHEDEERSVSLYPEHEHHDYRWAMAIDLDLCTGCSACVAACYIENNIPAVGPKEHVKGREMSWIRIEQHSKNMGKTQFIPMLCQHCDNAPCEPVCPVYASYHNQEGLNAQIYNRCVGTRYCSNNCPYKVRRFNWFHHEWPEPLDKMLNPDVSVREKGVMEKCTFCIQRIRTAKDIAKDESRKVRDGEVIPACAQSCPTKAIVFGNNLDEESNVHKMARQSNAHRAFESLGTEPAVYYITKNEKKDQA